MLPQIEVCSSLTVYRFGISFMAGKWTEPSLIGYAYAYEQMTKIRDTVKPFVVPTVDLAQVASHSNGWTGGNHTEWTGRNRKGWTK